MTNESKKILADRRRSFLLRDLDQLEKDAEHWLPDESRVPMRLIKELRKTIEDEINFYETHDENHYTQARIDHDRSWENYK